jgi:hypothetical protein
MITSVKGLREVMNNLNKEIKKIEGRSIKGLLNAAIDIKRIAEPTTPIDLGNLRSSFFIVTTLGTHTEPPRFSNDRGDAAELEAAHTNLIAEAKATVSAKAKTEKILIMGYSANYAAAVHEMVDAQFKTPGTMAKWFQLAISQNTATILKSVRDNIKIR